MSSSTIAKLPTREDAALGLRMIHSFLAATRPVWTNDPPKLPGYYWLRDNISVQPIVVQVRTDFSENPPPLVVQEGRAEDRGVEYLRDYTECQWCGPIETPDEQ